MSTKAIRINFKLPTMTFEKLLNETNINLSKVGPIPDRMRRKMRQRNIGIKLKLYGVYKDDNDNPKFYTCYYKHEGHYNYLRIFTSPGYVHQITDGVYSDLAIREITATCYFEGIKFHIDVNPWILDRFKYNSKDPHRYPKVLHETIVSYGDGDKIRATWGRFRCKIPDKLVIKEDVKTGYIYIECIERAYCGSDILTILYEENGRHILSIPDGNYKINLLLDRKIPTDVIERIKAFTLLYSL